MGVKVIAASVDVPDDKVLREMGDMMRAKLSPAGVVVLASNFGERIGVQVNVDVRNLSQSLIEVEAVMRGRNFVGGNVVSQFGIVRGILAVPGQIFARQLAFYQVGIVGEKENAALQPNLIRAFFDFAFEE